MNPQNKWPQCCFVISCCCQPFFLNPFGNEIFCHGYVLVMQKSIFFTLPCNDWFNIFLLELATPKSNSKNFYQKFQNFYFNFEQFRGTSRSQDQHILIVSVLLPFWYEYDYNTFPYMSSKNTFYHFVFNAFSKKKKKY